MTDADRGASRYTAFLSYSHKDSAAAHWLHRKLETYRIPRRLVGTDGEHGPVPARLTPIFRDREELAAAGDLSEKVRAALAESDNLIILCSPSSAASPWVGKEIAVFRALHPGRPIFAAIVEGEPDQCFPSGLAEGGVEPLAADLRPGRDGRRLGFLKLVAGLTGIGLDALVQRDAQRRLRRVTAVTAAAVAAMLVMAVLTAFALSARSEAERQRAKAEGLIEFMLTDLRTRLEGVGRLEIMQAVNARALDHYGKMDLESLSSESLLRRARLLRVIGTDSLTEGNFEDALAAFGEARRITAEQLDRAPGDPERQLQHARSNSSIGQIHELRQDWPKAEQSYGLAANATERLVRAAPDNPAYLAEAAWSAVHLGNIQLNGTRNFAAAQASYDKAVSRFAAVAAVKPGDQEILRDLGNAHGWLADSYYMRGMWRQSLASRLKQHAIVERLHVANPRNMETSFRFAAAERAVGHSYRKLGDHLRAAPFIYRAYGSALELTGHDPDNAEWLLFKAFAGCDLLFGKVGLPKDVTYQGVRDQVSGAAAKLRAQQNPRASELDNCLGAMNN